MTSLKPPATFARLVRPPEATHLAIPTLVLAVAVSLWFASGCSSDEARRANESASSPASTTVVEAGSKCPFRDPYDIESYQLPDRMSNPQLRACQAYFAPNEGSFAPGEAAFSTTYCYQHAQHAACQQTRVAVCTVLVKKRNFADLRRCLSATPRRRIGVLETPALTVELHEPWFAEGTTLWMDNEVGWAFPGAGRIDFYEAPDSAWDARAGAPTDFPLDLARFLDQNAYFKVVRSRAVRFGRFPAQQIDLIAGNKTDRKAFDAGYCGETSPNRCILISADINDEGFVSLALDAGAQTRLIDLKTSAGRVIIEVPGIGALNPRTGAGRLLRTLQLRTQ